MSGESLQLAACRLRQRAAVAAASRGLLRIRVPAGRRHLLTTRHGLQAASCKLQAAGLLLLAGLLNVAPVAQTRTVEILNADSVAVEETAGGTVRRLVGSVRLRQDTTYIEAPRAVQYVERGEVVLEGPVRVRTGRVTLTSDHVTYDSGTKIAAARGSVRLTDGVSELVAPSAHYAVREELAAFDAGGTLRHETSVLTAPRGTYDTSRRLAAFEGSIRLVDSTLVLTAERGTYDADERLADFRGAVRLEDSTSVLTAARGTYHRPTRRAIFGGSVRLERPAREDEAALRLEADSLVHYRREERSEAWGRVVLERMDEGDSGEDRPTRSILFGGEVTHDGLAEHSVVRGGDADPLMVVIRTDSTGRPDTTFARAVRLASTRIDTLGRRATHVTAVGNARLASRRFSAVADSASLVRIDSTGGADDSGASDRLTLVSGRPSVWADGAQITADTLRAWGPAGAPDTLRAIGQPFAAQLDSTLNRVRQLRGREMLAVFAEEAGERRVRRLSVWPNAEAVYFRADGEGLLAGAEIVTADSLTFLFSAGELRGIRGMRGIEGTSYGAEIVPADLQLDGYTFDPERRPTRDVLVPADSWEWMWLTAPEAAAEVADPGPGAAAHGAER